MTDPKAVHELIIRRAKLTRNYLQSCDWVGTVWAPFWLVVVGSGLVLRPKTHQSEILDCRQYNKTQRVITEKLLYN